MAFFLVLVPGKIQYIIVDFCPVNQMHQRRRKDCQHLLSKVKMPIGRIGIFT